MEEVLEEVEEVSVAAVEDVSNSILYASGVCSSEGGEVSQHECDLVIEFKEMKMISSGGSVKDTYQKCKIISSLLCYEL